MICTSTPSSFPNASIGNPANLSNLKSHQYNLKIKGKKAFALMLLTLIPITQADEGVIYLGLCVAAV